MIFWDDRIISFWSLLSDLKVGSMVCENLRLESLVRLAAATLGFLF